MTANRGYDQQARSMLRQRGQRVTGPRAAVLAAMLAASAESGGQGRSGSAFSHHDLLARLESGEVDPQLNRPDRVTLYRVLEWLVDIGLAHRIAGDDRVFRFSLNAPDAAGLETDAACNRARGHAHFHCAGCHRVYCLAESQGVAQALGAALPPGFVGHELAVSIQGLCPRCAKI